MKPTAHYTHIAYQGVGLSAYVSGVTDHPNHMEGHAISNDPGRTVQTSAAVSFDPETGRLETLNTVYVPRPGVKPTIHNYEVRS